MAYITNLPVNNVFNVTAFFGQENKSLWANGHKGIDVTGERILYSICDGVVTYTGYDSGWGYYVSVKPDGFDRVRFIICHLVKGSVKVKKGSRVARTTIIGTMGMTGNATGVHAHIECRIDNVAVDPTPYLKIKNEKAVGLNAHDYKTTVEESNTIIQKMIDKFDGKITVEENANYEKLYNEEKSKNAELLSQGSRYQEQNTELVAKINKIKEVLK